MTQEKLREANMLNNELRDLNYFFTRANTNGRMEVRITKEYGDGKVEIECPGNVRDEILAILRERKDTVKKQLEEL